jgi:hypothetical protein
MSNVKADLQVLRILQRSAQASGTPVEESDTNSAEPQADEVDLQQLAEKVLMLLKRELRVERERRGRS